MHGALPPPPALGTSTRSLTAAFTGHRAARLDALSNGDGAALYARILAAVREAHSEGKRIFLSGMATGFDTLGARAVLDLKKELAGLSLVCVFACPVQDAGRLALAETSDGVITLEKTCGAGSFLARDRFLVESSSLMIAGYDGYSPGGTLATLKLAEEKGRRVVFVRL